MKSHSTFAWIHSNLVLYKTGVMQSLISLISFLWEYYAEALPKLKSKGRLTLMSFASTSWTCTWLLLTTCFSPNWKKVCTMEFKPHECTIFDEFMWKPWHDTFYTSCWLPLTLDGQTLNLMKTNIRQARNKNIDFEMQHQNRDREGESGIKNLYVVQK